MTALPCDFGDGWMTGNARDLCKIAVALGGFDDEELARRVALMPSSGDRINTATVEKVLDAMAPKRQERGRCEVRS